MKKKRLLSLCLALLLLLTSCGEKAEEPTPSPMPPPPTVSATPTPTPTPAPSPSPEPASANPLTGLPMDEGLVGKRPVAIMLNNIYESLPQQGNSQADIIYECLEEGGITRMMGLYQSMEGVGTVGSIRSARSYYLQLALGHDAIYIHAGGSDEPKYEDAYGKIKAWGVTSLDGVRGPYMSNQVEGGLMWRDPTRKKNLGSVHSVVTTGDMVTRVLPTLTIRQEHEDGYAYQIDFADDGTPTGGADAAKLTIPFSNYKTGVFTYDAQSKLYLASEYGEPYIDGNTGGQIGVTNVVVIRAVHGYTGDKYGHITIDLAAGSGTGYYACGGKYVDILWSKSFPDGQLRYTDLDGNPITFGRGKTYVNVVPSDCKVSFE